MIENGIARLDIAQKIDKRNLIGLRTCEGAHDEVEISSSKPRPTIRSDHRDFIMGKLCPNGKSDCSRITRAEAPHIRRRAIFQCVKRSSWRSASALASSQKAKPELPVLRSAKCC